MTKLAEEERPKEYFKCWAAYSALLLDKGVDPAEHRAEFDEEWELSMSFLPQEEAEKMAQVLAKEVAAKAVPLPPKLKPPPPAVPVPPEGLDKLIWEFNTGRIPYDEYERRAKELKK